MKQIIKSIFPTLMLSYLLSMVACTGMDDYLKYTDGKAKLYTGRVDSVKFSSGDERVVFYGLLTSDPKITKVTIFWNNRADSLVINVNRTTGVDTLNVSIPLPEGRYNFEVFSYDANGNPSIPVNVSSTSYGNDYKESLYNRAVKKVEKIDDNVIIDWYNGDESSPYTQIDYTDLDDIYRVLKVSITEKQTILEKFKSMSKFGMQTYFLPDEMAVDTFTSKSQVISITNEDITKYIKNPGNPFIRAGTRTDKWDLLKDWQYTSNVTNQINNTAGGWSTDAGGVIHFESKDWGGEGITNGKIYQTISLPAGRYSLQFYSDGGGGSPFEGNFVVAEGTSLPDINEPDQTLAFYKWDNNNMGGHRSIEFSLETPKDVTVGWIASFGSNVWMHINYIKLIRLGE